MNNASSSYKKISKNAAVMFIRTFITIFISLFTSRVLLQKLGEDNFGIFSVVGGIAVMFSFLNNSFFTATQRFLTLSLGKNDFDEYKRIFTTSLNCYIGISFVIALLSETVGLYIVNYVLNIAPARLVAANYAYQFSIIAFVFGLTNAPYKASIVAHEKFSYFAYTDIWVKLMKLLIVYLMAISPGDKLIVYSALFMGVSLLRFISDKVFCHFMFKECRYIKYWDYSLFKSLTSFSGLTLLKSIALSGVNQCNNILINVFGGTVASASMGLANQVWGTITGFFLNVQAAFNPQIVKSWGGEEVAKFNALIINASKFSSYMVIFVAIPLVVNMHFWLEIWLKDVPEHAASFCSACIFACFVSAVVNPVSTAILAVGKIQRYQIVSSILLFLSIPFSFIALKLGYALIMLYVVSIAFQVIDLVYSANYLNSMVNFSLRKFMLNAIKNTCILGICLGVAYFVRNITEFNPLVTVILCTLSGWLALSIIVWIYDLTTNQRNVIYGYIKNRLR